MSFDATGSELDGVVGHRCLVAVNSCEGKPDSNSAFTVPFRHAVFTLGARAETGDVLALPFLHTQFRLYAHTYARAWFVSVIAKVWDIPPISGQVEEICNRNAGCVYRHNCFEMSILILEPAVGFEPTTC